MKTTKIATALALTTALFSSNLVIAKDSKLIKETIDIDKGHHVVVAVPVGSLEVETCACNEMSISVRVEPSNDGWFSSGKNVEDAELSIKRSQDEISFEVDMEKTKQKWRVTVPQSSAMDVEMGVGAVNIYNFDNSLNAEVGVGEVEVEVQQDNYQSIRLETGVGETKIRGMNGDTKTKRAVVSSKTRYSGNGDHDIRIEVGVGGAAVNVR